MSTYTLKSLAVSEDSTLQIETSEQHAGDQSSFKLVGLKDQNAAKEKSIVRISHKRHPDPSTRVDTKSRVMGGIQETPVARDPCVSRVPAAAKAAPAANTAAAGQRSDENREPVARLRLDPSGNRRNPVTGEGLTPTEVHTGRTQNIRNKSSITFISSPE